MHKTDFWFFNLTALYYTFNVRDKMKKMWGQNHVKKILDHLFGILPKTSVQIVKAAPWKKFVKQIFKDPSIKQIFSSKNIKK